MAFSDESRKPATSWPRKFHRWTENARSLEQQREHELFECGGQIQQQIQQKSTVRKSRPSAQDQTGSKNGLLSKEKIVNNLRSTSGPRSTNGSRRIDLFETIPHLPGTLTRQWKEGWSWRSQVRLWSNAKNHNKAREGSRIDKIETLHERRDAGHSIRPDVWLFQKHPEIQWLISWSRRHSLREKIGNMLQSIRHARKWARTPLLQTNRLETRWHLFGRIRKPGRKRAWYLRKVQKVAVGHIRRQKVSNKKKSSRKTNRRLFLIQKSGRMPAGRKLPVQTWSQVRKEEKDRIFKSAHRFFNEWW